jgi:hypothetical protein
MKYKAIDGTILESNSNQTVTYTCDVDNHAEGVFISYETYPSSSPIGIQQIKIVRTVIGNQMTIEITESTEQELLDYINQIQNQIEE